MISKVRVSTDHTQWHRWFAVRPRRIWAGKTRLYVWVWWQWIERRIISGYLEDHAEYRLLK